MARNQKITHWQGKTVWVVGGSHGIGFSVSQQLIAQGAKVILSGRQEQALINAQQQLGEQAHIMAFDASIASEWLRVIELLMEQPLDCVMLFQGTYQAVRAGEESIEQIDQMVKSNQLSMMYGVCLLTPWLKKQGRGHIVLTGSLSGFCGMPNALIYGMTKASLMNYAQTLSIDLKPYHIDITLLSPGFVQTRLTANNDFAMPQLLTPNAAASFILRGLAKGRFHIKFPGAFSLLINGIRHLPEWLYFLLMDRIARKASHERH